MKHIVYAIGREFGSGGREIGQKLAAELGIQCYDSRLIEQASKDGGIDTDVLRQVEEKRASGMAYASYYAYSPDTRGYGMPMNDTLFNLQTEVIFKLATKESCVIIGRCADDVLSDMKEAVSVFVFADLDARIKRIMERYKVDEKLAKGMIKKYDKQRRNYYNYYTDKEWGKRNSYDMCLSSSRLGIDQCVKILKAMAEE